MLPRRPYQSRRIAARGEADDPNERASGSRRRRSTTTRTRLPRFVAKGFTFPLAHPAQQPRPTTRRGALQHASNGLRLCAATVVSAINPVDSDRRQPVKRPREKRCATLVKNVRLETRDHVLRVLAHIDDNGRCEHGFVNVASEPGGTAKPTPTLQTWDVEKMLSTLF